MLDNTAQNGVPTVLLVKDPLFFEIAKKEGDTLELVDASGGRVAAKVADMAGYQPVPVTRVIKGNGERVYYDVGQKTQFSLTGVRWFTKGGIYA